MRRFLRPAMFGPAGPSALSVTSIWSNPYATYATAKKKKQPSPPKKISPKKITPKKKQTPVKKSEKKKPKAKVAPPPLLVPVVVVPPPGAGVWPPPGGAESGMSRTRERPPIDGAWYTTKNTEHLALAVQLQRTPNGDACYSTNRAMSLMYYWLYLVGTQSYNPEILNGIIGKNFMADFKQSRVLSHVSNSAELLVFLQDRARNIAHRHRSVHNFTAKVLPDGNIDVHADFEENGVDKEGSKYATHSRHHWVMSSNPTEPFARFEQCQIMNILPDHFTGFSPLVVDLAQGCTPCAIALPPKSLVVDYRQKNMEHLALVQYYRWYQVYERELNDARLQNTISIFHPDVVIESPSGVTNGTTVLREKIEKFKGWRNAHHVKNVASTSDEDGTLHLTAQIMEQNIKPDDTTAAFNIAYSMTMKAPKNDGTIRSPSRLPLITHVKRQPTSAVVPPPPYEDAYATNRARALLHYWLYLVGTRNYTPEIFDGILGKGFVANFKTSRVEPNVLDKVRDSADLIARLRDRGQNVVQMYREPRNFTAVLLADEKTIDVHFDCEEFGENTSGDKYTHKTHHHWLMSNNPDEPFARFEQCSIMNILPY